MLNGDAGTRREFTARYFVESAEPLQKVAEVIAGEQSSGTFLDLPGETDEIRQRARARVTEAYKNIQAFGDQAEIIRFETSKAEKELFEAGVDQQKLLSAKPLFRPKMPAENWNYWKFQGEFWRDEIGYYQYTLKRGCPARAGE